MKLFNLSTIIAIAILQIIGGEKTISNGHILAHHDSEPASVDRVFLRSGSGSGYTTMDNRILDQTDDDNGDEPEDDPEPALLGQMFTLTWIILLSPIAVFLRTVQQVVPAFRGLYIMVQESMCESIDFWELELNPFGICSDRLYL